MDESPLKLKVFVTPITQVLLGLAQASSNATNAAGLRQPMLKVGRAQGNVPCFLCPTFCP